MLVRQHAEDAAFLFVQRGRAFHGQSWDETQLGRTDQRIAGNIAGLVAAGKTGLEIAAEYAETVGGAGEIFTLAVTAFAQGQAVEFTLAAGLGSPAGRKGLSGALAWTEPRLIGPQVKRWLESGEEGLRFLGLVALSHHRSDPGAMLAGFLTERPDWPLNWGGQTWQGRCWNWLVRKSGRSLHLRASEREPNRFTTMRRWESRRRQSSRWRLR